MCGKTQEERGGCKGCGGGENLEGVQDVAGKQCENRHHQDGFQLFVVRASTTKVVACRLFGVVLDGQALADSVRRNVRRAVMTEFPVMYLPIVRLIGEPYLVVARNTP